MKGGRILKLNERFIQDLQDKIDIDSVISSYVNLKRRGKTLVGLCPFHNEKTPSFTVYPESNSFYCFGCGAGGDVITFIMKIQLFFVYIPFLIMQPDYYFVNFFKFVSSRSLRSLLSTSLRLKQNFSSGISLKKGK